ncbi:MAG: threonine ammonia-lyase [Armatimonadota bacterium]|nr:threonine ammonia-lyase [Armatimonadota bacterium]MDR7443948.1 threonine ammonia-lyase [Armatimonadota bacterium]MDR7570046.1 threonine ammonia-lyase [Armatimonadota bacterium]MDR7615449.1 threonine ammonia-lyase [Armatimonadota bacterium]
MRDADFHIRLEDIREAAAALRPHVHQTPLLRAGALGRLAGVELWLKAENLQRTGSFKVRGAFNRIRLLSVEERRRGVVAASAGNHAQGVALAARELGVRATVVMPEGAPLVKVESTRGYGAEVVLYGQDFEEAFAHARTLQEQHGAVLVHAFDDPAVIAGQGTVGLEIVDQLPEVEAVVVPVGGGGLAAGVAVAVKSLRPDVRVVGVQAAAAPAVWRAWHEGRVVEVPARRTLADGLAVRSTREGVLRLLRRWVDDMVTVEEDELAGAMVLLLERAKLVAEGAGAAAVAALVYGKTELRDVRTVAVVSGGNVDLNTLVRVVDRGLVKTGRLLRLRTRLVDRPGSLRRLLDVVAHQGANVVTVEHDRLAPEVPIGEAEVTLLVETRDAEHARVLLSAVEAAGFSVRGD